MASSSTHGRIDTLDSLRGLALLGILAVNLTYFAHSIYAETVLVETGNVVASWLVAFFGQVKAFVLFAFLFGYGLAVQIERAAARGEALGPRYARRLVGIFAFGIVHAVFLFSGDVLTLYAALGVVLWAVRRWSPHRLVVLAAVSLAVASVGFGALGAFLGSGPIGGGDEAAQLVVQADAAFAGSFLDAAAQRLRDLPSVLPFLVLYNGPVSLAMFALGLAAGKVRLFSDTERYRATLLRALPWALVVGVAGNVAYATASALPPAMVAQVWGGPLPWWAGALSMAVVTVAGPALAFAYVVGVVEAERAGRLEWALRPLRAAGRMSLTNYLGESLLAGFVFFGWGLSVGHLGLLECLLLTPVLFGVLVVFSRAWLQRFRSGPLEWALRSWTYGAWQPVHARPGETSAPRPPGTAPVAR